MNIWPESLACERGDAHRNATAEHAVGIVAEALGSGRVAIAASTENIVSNENLLALMRALEHCQ